MLSQRLARLIDLDNIAVYIKHYEAYEKMHVVFCMGWTEWCLKHAKHECDAVLSDGTCPCLKLVSLKRPTLCRDYVNGVEEEHALSLGKVFCPTANGAHHLVLLIGFSAFRT